MKLPSFVLYFRNFRNSPVILPFSVSAVQYPLDICSPFPLSLTSENKTAIPSYPFQRYYCSKKDRFFLPSAEKNDPLVDYSKSQPEYFSSSAPDSRNLTVIFPKSL